MSSRHKTLVKENRRFYDDDDDDDDVVGCRGAAAEGAP